VTPNITLYNQDNMSPCGAYDKLYDFIYADCIYENPNLDWVYNVLPCLKTDGIFVVQTDWHTVAEYKVLLDNLDGAYESKLLTFVNWLTWKCEWGNFSKRRFHQVHDDILIYSKGDGYKFYPERAQVNKVTKNKGLNPSGRETKTATSWIDDICLTTTSKERVKKEDGHLVRWQKPEALMERLLLPFTDEDDDVLDLFAGTGTLGVVCKKHNRNYTGIEIDPALFIEAELRINR